MHQRWEQRQHTGQGHQVLASASEALGGNSTAAIGIPNKPGMMQMAQPKGASKNNGVRSTSQTPRPPRWQDTIPVGGNKAVHAALQSEVNGLRARIRAAGLADGPKGALNGNLAAAKVIMKDGTSKTFYSYSSMSKLNKPTQHIAAGLAKDPNLAKMFVEDRVPHVQTKLDFGYPNHTEPRLLNYILSEHDVNDIAEVHLFTERPPCSGSCGPYVLQSWRNGQWQAVPWQPPQNSVVVPETQGIPLYVYDANGDRW